MSEESTFVKRRLLLSGPKNIKDVALAALKKTPLGRAAGVVGAGIGAAATGFSLKDDESYKEGREEGKEEGKTLKEKVKKNIGKTVGTVEGVVNKSKGGSVIAKVKLGRTKPTKLF